MVRFSEYAPMRDRIVKHLLLVQIIDIVTDELFFRRNRGTHLLLEELLERGVGEVVVAVVLLFSHRRLI